MGDANYKRAARAIKAAGLQKLRWYCQVCQKQCRDDNGFKCHTMSESHQRFAESGRFFFFFFFFFFVLVMVFL